MEKGCEEKSKVDYDARSTPEDGDSNETCINDRDDLEQENFISDKATVTEEKQQQNSSPQNVAEIHAHNRMAKNEVGIDSCKDIINHAITKGPISQNPDVKMSPCRSETCEVSLDTIARDDSTQNEPTTLTEDVKYSSLCLKKDAEFSTQSKADTNTV